MRRSVMSSMGNPPDEDFGSPAAGAGEGAADVLLGGGETAGGCGVGEPGSSAGGGGASDAGGALGAADAGGAAVPGRSGGGAGAGCAAPGGGRGAGACAKDGAALDTRVAPTTQAAMEPRTRATTSRLGRGALQQLRSGSETACAVRARAAPSLLSRIPRPSSTTRDHAATAAESW